MATSQFERSVFINCPFDEQYAHLLVPLTFCVVYFGFTPRLASEGLDAGENRLEKIIELIKGSMYSIHDLSRCKSLHNGEPFRMNMPFEFGLDMGLRHSGVEPFEGKKFLIFEEQRYDLKPSLSDIAGMDPQPHENDYQLIIKKVREFFHAEAGVRTVGPAKLASDYATFLGWMTEKKIHEGHSKKEALDLPTSERLEEMRSWVELGMPVKFRTIDESR